MENRAIVVGRKLFKYEWKKIGVIFDVCGTLPDILHRFVVMFKYEWLSSAHFEKIDERGNNGDIFE